jgi:hypothetical protein
MSAAAEHAAFDREIATLASAGLLGATPSRRPFMYWVFGLAAAFVAAMFLPLAAERAGQGGAHRRSARATARRWCRP